MSGTNTGNNVSWTTDPERSSPASFYEQLASPCLRHSDGAPGTPGKKKKHLPYGPGRLGAVKRS